MPKPISELLGPESAPPRQPHTAIVELLRTNDASQAYTCDEIIDAVRSQVPSWRFAGICR